MQSPHANREGHGLPEIIFNPEHERVNHPPHPAAHPARRAAQGTAWEHSGMRAVPLREHMNTAKSNTKTGLYECPSRHTRLRTHRNLDSFSCVESFILAQQDLLIRLLVYLFM
ncbi:hypothetical protein EVAR_18635_1 [Eumeta japonica]|uniref:Uncharacterized protein n=1 Tax=Eumeta variegata TaxID=151549 RepID=A0A4C1U7U7_EUMVA|nr:hypothetical protein EVAR_18635_1 [Eumeta japonica]